LVLALGVTWLALRQTGAVERAAAPQSSEAGKVQVTPAAAAQPAAFGAGSSSGAAATTAPASDAGQGNAAARSAPTAAAAAGAPAAATTAAPAAVVAATPAAPPAAAGGAPGPTRAAAGGALPTPAAAPRAAAAASPAAAPAGFNLVQRYRLLSATGLTLCWRACEPEPRPAELRDTVARALDRTLPLSAAPAPTPPAADYAAEDYVTLTFTLPDGQQVALGYDRRLNLLRLPNNEGWTPAPPELAAALAGVTPPEGTR
jgi:hypothetical protein